MGDMADYLLEQCECVDDYDGDFPNKEFRREAIRTSGPGPCPKCGKETKLLDGKFGKFYGCPDYPTCNGNRYFVGGDKIGGIPLEDTTFFICDNLGCPSHITLIRDKDNKLASCGSDLVQYCPFCGKKYGKESEK